MIGLGCRITLVATVALAVTTVWPAARPVDATPNTTVAIRVAYPWIVSGQAEHIDGQVSPPVPAGSVPEVVTLQQLSANVWHDVKTATLNQHAAFDIAVKPALSATGTFTYRVTWNGIASPSVTFTVRVLIYIGLANVQWIELGQAAHVRGWMSPRLSDQLVWLQQQDPTTSLWTDVRSDKTDGFGRYDVAVKPNAAGIYTYRIMWQNTASVHTVMLPVETWHYLSDLTPVFNPTTYQTGTVLINGTNFPHSIWWESDTAFPTTSAQFRMKYHCDQFHATIGLSNNSAADAKIEVAMTRDGYDSYEHVVTAGSSVSAYSNMTYAYRLLITTTALTPDTGVGNIAFGSAQIRCAW